MGKQKPKYNFTLSDALGDLDLSKDSAVQEAKAGQAARASQDTLSSTSILPNTVQFLQHEKSVYDEYLKPGQFGGTPEELDYKVAEGQSTTRQMLNGVGRLLPLVTTKLIGQGNGLVQAAEYGKKWLAGEDTSDVFYDNELSKSIEGWEASIKDAMPIYATEQYDKGSLLEQMGTAKFWADDVGDGVAFLAATMLGTKGMGAGLKTIGKGATYLNKVVPGTELLAKVPGAAKIASAVANNYTAATAGVMNAGFSASLQAQDTFNQIKEGLAGKTNPDTGDLYSEEEIKMIAGEKAGHTFNATFLAHIGPGIWESKIFLGLNKAKLGDVRQSIMGAVNRGEVTISELLAGTGRGANLLKNAAKAAGKGAVKGAAIEGLWEENIEQSIQKYDVQDGLAGGKDGAGELALKYTMGLIGNLGVKEDAKAVVLGMILGAPMGAVGGYGEAKSFNERMPGFLNALRSSETQYQADIKGLYKTHAQDVKDVEGKVIHQKGSIIIDDLGNPIHDPEKIKNLTFQAINSKNLADKQAIAILTGNADMAEMNENMALSSAVFRELATAAEDEDTEGALDFLKWRIEKQLEEQSNEEANKTATDISTAAVADAATPEDPQGNIEAEQASTQAKSAAAGFNGRDRADLSRTINANLSKLDTFAKAYKDAKKQSQNLSKIGQKPERMAFNHIVQKGLYYESVKRASMDAMIEERKNLLQDPMVDIEAVTKEINAITRLRDESLQRSKGYLTNTDELYTAYMGPRGQYEVLAKGASKLNNAVKDEQNPEERAKTERKRDTVLYQLNELNEIEGLGASESRAPTFNEEIISTPIAERVDKPVGTKNGFLWNAANDYTKLAALNEKIELYKQGKLKLIDVINYAKENITNLDSETYKKLNSLLSTEREKLAALEQTISQTDEQLFEIDEDGEMESRGTNPEYLELNGQRMEMESDIAEAEKVLKEKGEASELELINNQPENVFKHLIKQYALKFFEKGKYVLRNALDENGEVREDYFNRDMVNLAIKELTMMRNAMQDRLDDGDLKGVKGLSHLIADADKMLDKLYEIREKTELNRNNLGAKQSAINRAEATSLISAMGYDLATGAVINSAAFSAVDAVLDGTLNKALKDIGELDGNHYEATMALLHKVQTKAAGAQLGTINSQLKASRVTAQAIVAELLNSKGVNSIIIRDFAKNPRQMFTSAWTNISHSRGEEGYVRQTNSKGTLFNTFRKNNDIDELIFKAEMLPEDTKELGMPKADFLKLTAAYKLAVSAEKLGKMLNNPIRPIVELELKEAEEAPLVPTTQQDISIREGVAWLNNKDKSSSPFRGWAFLRGIAGTGKTNVVLKWILNTSGVDKSEILTTALTRTATEVAAKSTGTTATLFEDLEKNGIPDNVKLIIIDEYGTIGVIRLEALERQVQELRRTGRDIKVLMLGDPTQLTPRLSSNDDINNVSKNLHAGNIEIINPVTVVYRSDVSAVNEASDLFQDNNKQVGLIKVRADKPVGSTLTKGVHTSADNSQIPDIIARSITEESQTGQSPRTRAVIVGRPEDVEKYKDTGVDVLTVFDAQSRTYDEVYVDIPKTAFPDEESFNTAMYTAASRAKLYSFLTYSQGENTLDTSITQEYSNNVDRLKESKTVFIQAKTAELAMMDGLDKGQSVKQAGKEAKKEAKDAGKSTLDLEVQQSATEDFTETTAEVPSVADNSDSPVDPELNGDVDPDTEQPAEGPQEVPTVEGTRQPVDNVDAEAYPALKSGRIGAKHRNKVLYIYNKETNGENAVTIIAQDTEGKWVKIGKIFQEQILNDPRFADIRTKVAGMKAFPTPETDVLNGRLRNDIPLSPAELAAYAVREGKISGSQYLRLLYKKGLQDSKNLASDIGNIFREKFYYKSQEAKAKQVRFKIFTIKELGDKYDGTFKPLPGIPYAVIGSDGVSYKNAMFVRLQANRIQQDDDQIKTLKTLTDSIAEVQRLTGIEMGTKAFYDLLRVFRNSIDIVQEQNEDNTGTVPKMQAKVNFSREEIIQAATDMFESDDRDGNPDLLKNVPDDKLEYTIAAVQHLTMQMYGIKNKNGKYTKAEIEVLGEEYEAIPMTKKSFRKGEELFYARIKTGGKFDYKTDPRLEVENSVAQIAFNQIARANEFIGDRRIRVEQHLGRTNTDAKGERKKSYTGKSLINSEGGNSRVWELINLVAVNLVGPELEAKGEADMSTKQGLEMAREGVRKLLHSSGTDQLIFLKKLLEDTGDAYLIDKAQQIIQKKETYPVTLSTLQILTDPKNFDGSGGHMTADPFHIRTSEGTLEPKQTFVRKPLHIDKFNELGSNPFENAEELGKLVHTSFDGISPTKIDVDFGDVEVQPTSEDLADTLPVEEITTTEHHAGIDSQIEALKAQIAGLDSQPATPSREVNNDFKNGIGYFYDLGYNVDAQATFAHPFSIHQNGEVDINPDRLQSVYSSDSTREMYDVKRWASDSSEMTQIHVLKKPIVKNVDGKAQLLSKGILYFGNAALDSIDSDSKKAKVKLTLELNKLIKSKGRMPYDTNAARPEPGKRISIKEAMADLKRMIPGITAGEIEFASKAVMSQLAKPGENLLGLFDKGKIFLQTEDGTVYDKVLRHEVMHKIYNEFLTNKERRQLRAELDPTGRLTGAEFDEHLADLFMNWQKGNQGFGQKVRAIFDKIMGWFGFYHGNRSTMETIFRNVESGKYSHKIGGTSDVRRAFSDITKDFGSVANYQQAVKAVHGMVREAVMLNDLESTPITMKESKEYVKQQLTKQRVELTESLADLKDSAEVLTEEDGELFTEVQDSIADTVAQLSTLNAMLPLDKKGNITDKVFTQLWKDMYPNYNFKAGEGISAFEDDTDEYTEHDDLDEAQLEKEESASKLQDFTLSPEERNQEGKVTDNVKNFLSFIFRPTGTRVNPRYAYLECLRTLNGLVSSEGNLKDQIREAATANGIDLEGKSDGKLVIRHILNLIDNATSEYWMDEKGNHVDLPKNARFYSEDRFYMVQEGGDLSSSSEADIVVNGANTSDFTRNPGESTPLFIARIARDTGLDKKVLVGYFKQGQAQETMREVMSNFLSQRESDPMIAEEVQEGKMGNRRTILRYLHAQMHGAERIAAADIEEAIKDNWLKIPTEVWAEYDKSKDSKEKIKLILNALGLKKELNLTQISGVVENFDAFRNLVNDAYVNGKPKPLKRESEDGVIEEDPFVEYRDIEYLLIDESKMINRLTKILTRNSADARPSKYQSVDGKSRYSFHNSNQALEMLQRVVHSTGTFARKQLGLPAHLKTEWAKLNPFIEGKLNIIHKILDHDGMRREWGEEFAKGYTDESNKDNWARQFSYGFLSFIKMNTGKSDPTPSYVQFFYTISNRPRMVGAEVNVLRPKELREAARKMLVQHLEQPEHSSIVNYDKYKTINMEEMGKAIVKVMGKNDKATHDSLRKAWDTGALMAIGLGVEDKSVDKAGEDVEKILDVFENNLKAMAKSVADKMVSEKMLLGDDAGQVLNLLKDNRRKYLDSKLENGLTAVNQKYDNLSYTAEQILPLVETWVMNNYINGYFLNQIPVGNFNYFKDALDLVKRMSGVFAPGTKGLVGDTFFMKQKFKMAVMEDPKIYSDELSAVFKDNDTALYNEVKNDLSRPNLKGVRTENGVEMADAQGFMLPSRAENIIAGMGKAYNAGAIFKPAHYEVVEREIPAVLDKEGKVITPGYTTYVPIMFKYSTAVLSDDLVAKFPKLKKLRDEMIRAEVDEVLFDSGTKVGKPKAARPSTKYNSESTGFTIPDAAVVTLSNENFRLQLNPKHDTFSKVANPTQLGYFLNVMSKLSPAAGKINDEAAVEVYTAIGNLIKHGLNKVTRGLNKDGRVSQEQLARTLTGAGNERIAEMLKELSYNMPNIADKALIQIMNMFSKDTVKIKFRGGKFVLQSAYGFEMVKKGSDRYNQMSTDEQIAHDANWSRYGEAEREALGVQARGLKYGTDEKGRMYAEVLIDKSFADKVKAGDFLLPDMMAYRVPSTELHSSIAVRVAGFYDSKGSNVIVAPPELVKQHGSDFDVDALYVIGREITEPIAELEIDVDTPVGYEWNSGLNKWVFNKQNWEKKILSWRQKAGTDKKLNSKVDKLYEMLQRNIIVESFLNVISHPLNIPRMTEPISTVVISDAMEKLGLDTERTVDLSNPIDNQEVFNSNFQGLALVGIFANGMKSLAYMLKAGADNNKGPEYPTLQVEGSGVTLGEDTYSEFKEALPDGKNIWQVLDALVNTAVDNVKDQKLFKINATNATGNMYVASQALAIPLKDVITFMLQPIGLMFSKVDGKIEVLKTEIVSAYNAKAEIPVNNYSELAALGNAIDVPSLKTMEGLINKTLEELEVKDILKQVRMMRSFENLHTLGQDITTFSSAVGIVQDFPVMYKDIETKQDKWDKMGRVEGDTFATNADFSFNLNSLFQSQPNIREAYKAFQFAKETAELSLTKHLDSVRAFVDGIADVVKLSYGQNKEDIKNELISYLISSIYSEVNRQESPYTYMYKNAERVATGRHAWSQRFAESVEAMRKKDPQNTFLKKIGIQTRYGMKSITFATSSNSDYMDNLEMQEAFDQIESEELKQDFVRYAIMNYGLKFGVKNYSMFIPAQYLKPVDQYLAAIDKKLRDNKIEDGVVVKGELKNLKDNFLLRLAVNNADKLPFISSKDRGKTPGISPIPTEGKTVVVNDPIDGLKEVAALTGFDEYYYDRKFANPMNGDKRTHKDERFPLFIRTGSNNMVLMRLNDADNDFVYYQKVGMKNWMGGYDADKSAINGDYTISTYFGKGVIPLPVADIKASSYQIINDYVEVGSKVIIYGYSNETRDQGRFGIVETVNTDLTNKSKKTITIRDVDPDKLTVKQEDFLKKYNPVMQRLSARFKIPVKAITELEMMDLVGEHYIKGAIRNGVAYVNMDHATGDTAFHEVSHVIINAIADRNPQWYQQLVKEAKESVQGKELRELIALNYKGLTESELDEELVVSILGQLAENKLDSRESKSLKSLLKRLWREIGNVIRAIMKNAGVINLDVLSTEEMASLTLNDISAILAAKNTNISLDLSGYIREDKMSRELDELEQRLFKEGRIELSCKV